jgi:hypothetical protein
MAINNPSKTRFTVEYRGATYETTAKVRAGDWVVIRFGQEYPQIVLTKITSLGSEYEGSCRSPIAIIRGGREIQPS